MSKSRLKAAEKKQREKELDKKFELFLHSAKHAMSKHSSKSETSTKISNLESDKQKSSAESGENVAEDQHLKIMEEPAFTAQERLKVLNARDSLIRLNIKSEETERKKVIGSCPDMCPEKERYSRIAKNCLSVLEMKMALDPKTSSRDADHRYMIKEYSRSSADQQEPLPHELRPVSVLKFTMDYIICNLMDMQLDAVTIRDWYDFIWNR
ncbi:MCM3-associated protein, partial [Stegodyphus mimosarum]